MDKKICTKCKKEKELTVFSKRSVAKNTYAPWCKECFAEYDRNRWNNGDSVRKIRNKKNIIRRNRVRLWELLTSSSCMDCSDSDPVILEFDHREPEQKLHNISEMLSSALSWKRIQAEIDKCDIVCANCHRRRTAKTRGFWKLKMGSDTIVG